MTNILADVESVSPVHSYPPLENRKRSHAHLEEEHGGLLDVDAAGKEVAVCSTVVVSTITSKTATPSGDVQGSRMPAPLNEPSPSGCTCCM